MIRWLLLAALLSGCTPLPQTYPVPDQRNSKDGPEPEPLGPFVTFSDARSPDYIVGGFLPGSPDSLWRWANEAFTVRVRVSDRNGLRLLMKFAFPDESHKPLLPITVKYFVNDKLLDTVVYKQAGVLEYRKPVPLDWLLQDADNLIRVEISPVYVAKADGVKLSMIVSDIGLEANK